MKINRLISITIGLGTVLLSGCPRENTDESSENKADQEIKQQDVAGNEDWREQQRQFDDHRKKGTNFLAMGNEPAWFMSNNVDGNFQMVSKGQDTLKSKGAEGMRPQDLNAIVYRFSGDKGGVSVTAYNDSCQDPMSGEMYPYKVTATYRNQNGEVISNMGCGLFLTDPALHDNWVMRSWNAIKDPGNVYVDGSPRLKFRFDDNTLTGYDGECEIKGKIEPMGDRIRIFNLDYKDASCKPEKRSEFFDHLNMQEHVFRFAEGQLVLGRGMDEMVFARAR